MLKAREFVLVPLLFTALFGCVRTNVADLNIREEYAICFSSRDGAAAFKEYLVSFAREEEMDILDRSLAAEMELRSLERGNVILDNTAGALILLTIERRNRLRISITNAALDGDLNLTFRYNSEPRPAEATSVLEFANQGYRVIPINDAGHSAPTCGRP